MVGRRLRRDATENSEILDLSRAFEEMRRELDTVKERNRLLEASLEARQREEQLANNARHSGCTLPYNLNDNGIIENSNIPRPISACSLGYVVKPDSFDGTISLREYLVQFEFVAKANSWDESSKVLALASCLRGKARSVLDSIRDPINISFADLKSHLELRFGEHFNAQKYYTEFCNRKQKENEDLASLASDLDRLVRLAYPESPYEIQEKISCAQFMNAISDPFIRQTLQLEGIRSLSLATTRAIEIKNIRENNIKRSSVEKFNNVAWKDFHPSHLTGRGRMAPADTSVKNFNKRRDGEKRNFQGSNECWYCGKKGHFRADCPKIKHQEN